MFSLFWGGEGVSTEIGSSVRLPVWRLVSRHWLSNWRPKCSSKRRIKLSNFSRKYCSDFLDLEILRFLSLWNFFWNGTSSGVSVIKTPFYRRPNFTGNHTNRLHFWGPVHSKIEEFRHSNRRFIKGCITLCIGRIFSSSELVEPHINAFKVRLAVTLKEEAKRQVFVRDCENYRITGVCPVQY